MNFYDSNRLGRKVSTIYGGFDVGTSPISKPINGRLCTVNVLSGVVWVNPLGVATIDSIELTGAIDIVVDGDISLISNADGAKVQIIVWG